MTDYRKPAEIIPADSLTALVGKPVLDLTDPPYDVAFRSGVMVYRQDPATAARTGATNRKAKRQRCKAVRRARRRPVIPG